MCGEGTAYAILCNTSSRRRAFSTLPTLSANRLAAMSESADTAPFVEAPMAVFLGLPGPLPALAALAFFPGFLYLIAEARLALILIPFFARAFLTVTGLASG